MLEGRVGIGRRGVAKNKTVYRVAHFTSSSSDVKDDPGGVSNRECHIFYFQGHMTE
jgi:hypothetical protein